MQPKSVLYNIILDFDRNRVSLQPIPSKPIMPPNDPAEQQPQRQRQPNEPHDRFIKQFVPIVLKNLFDNQRSSD
jgi:hypothetical protein